MQYIGNMFFFLVRIYALNIFDVAVSFLSLKPMMSHFIIVLLQDLWAQAGEYATVRPVGLTAVRSCVVGGAMTHHA